MDEAHPTTVVTPRPLVPFLGAFETTYLPAHDVDLRESTGHARAWRADIDADLAAGVAGFRYAIPWHRVEATQGRFDWTALDPVMEHLRASGTHVVVDLLHHTCHPGWLTDGLRDPRLPAAFAAFARAAAERYPWLPAYTLVNEPFETSFLCGHEAIWPPYDHGLAGFARIAASLLTAIRAASAELREVLPDARHVWVDTCEHHAGTEGGPAAHAVVAEDRRFVLLDLALGHDLDPRRPFLGALLRHAGGDLSDAAPVPVDVLGLDYYCTSEWLYEETAARCPSPEPLGFAAVAAEYHARYGLPLLLAETNVRGLPTDRSSWLRYVLEQYETGLAAGLPLEGFCWFPSVDSRDWDSLLARAGGRPDPVGVRGGSPDGSRTRTAFTEVWEAAVAGVPSADLPAYRFQPPCDTQLAGYVRALDHWPWEDPPDALSSSPIHIPLPERTPTVTDTGRQPVTPDLVVLSHLRWTWVWQRPQHLVSRFAAQRAEAGARTWFVEEPEAADVEAPCLVTDETAHGVTRVRLLLARADVPVRHLGFDTGSREYGTLLVDLLRDAGNRPADVLLYTPMALDLAEAIGPERLLYDVMDDLASFSGAPDGIRLRYRRALAEADVVYAGGRSLHRAAAARRSGPTVLVPSGVEAAHFARSAALRRPHDRPVAGYVGVVDERLDLDLLARLADHLPDWTVRVVGPVAKIDPDDLPRPDNVEYLGMARYEDLPEILAGFDVALMPFALNDATRSISPTKTLEYLAAGLPVVSTRVPDVVADHASRVVLADDGAGFAAACRRALHETPEHREARIRLVSRDHEWDVIADRMMAASTDDRLSVTRTGA